MIKREKHNQCQHLSLSHRSSSQVRVSIQRKTRCDFSLALAMTLIVENPQKRLPNVTFDKYEAKDAQNVSILICRCLKEVNARDYTPEQIAGMLPGFAPEKLNERFAGTYAVVVRDVNTIVAVGLLARDEIRTVFVSPDVHGRGIGTALMDHLENTAIKNGIAIITLFSSVSSRAFYLSRGYEELEQVDHPIGGRMYRMQKARES